ncbi:MAG: ABC transporter permease [Brevinematia bacterium]
MFRRINLFVASRYVKLSGRDALSKISLVAFLSIFVGAATSIVVLSITNGFREDLKQKIVGKDAHIVVVGRGLGIKNYEEFSKSLKDSFSWVKDADPYYQGQGLIRVYGDNILGSLIVGSTANSIDRYKKYFKLIYGDFNLSSGDILLAETLAYNVGARVGTVVEVIVKPPTQDLPVVKKFKVKGIFSTGYGEYDSILSVISLEDAQKLFNVGKLAYGINVMVDDIDKVKEYKYQILNKYSGSFIVLTWQDTNRNLFEAMYNQKTIMIMILFLFFIVVSFGILGTMMSLSLDKKSEIAILKAIGMRSSDIVQVFVISGAFLGIIGSLSGIILGLLISINLESITLGLEDIINFFIFKVSYPIAKFINPITSYPEKFEFFKSNVYYIKSFPTKIEFLDLVLVSLFAITVSVIASLLPALRTSKLKPAEILRNE